MILRPDMPTALHYKRRLTQLIQVERRVVEALSYLSLYTVDDSFYFITEEAPVVNGLG